MLATSARGPRGRMVVICNTSVRVHVLYFWKVLTTVMVGICHDHIVTRTGPEQRNADSVSRSSRKVTTMKDGGIRGEQRERGMEGRLYSCRSRIIVPLNHGVSCNQDEITTKKDKNEWSPLRTFLSPTDLCYTLAECTMHPRRTVNIAVLAVNIRMQFTSIHR